MKITIQNELLEKVPSFHIRAFSMQVRVRDSEHTSALMTTYEHQIEEEYSLEDVLNIPLIKEARQSYKAWGKDPSRYRLAVESLFRRLVKGFGLYRINNVVDVGNILSLELKRSTAILDLDQIQGDILIRLGTQADVYEGIGRGLLNVESIPLYCDQISPFGSPTSDTLRTAVTDQTQNILVFIICFVTPLATEDITKTIDLFKTYTDATHIQEIEVIKKV